MISSPRHTCVIVIVFNQHLGKGEVLLNTGCNTFVNKIWENLVCFLWQQVGADSNLRTPVSLILHVPSQFEFFRAKLLLYISIIVSSLTLFSFMPPLNRQLSSIHWQNPLLFGQLRNYKKVFRETIPLVENNSSENGLSHAGDLKCAFSLLCAPGTKLDWPKFNAAIIKWKLQQLWLSLLIISEIII